MISIIYAKLNRFTYRNMVFNGCNTAIYINFAWIFTFTGVTITNCATGIDMTSGGFTNQAVGSVMVLDSTVSAATGILTTYVPGASGPQSGGTLVVENVDFSGSSNAIATSAGRIILPGGTTVPLFAQGNAWTTAGQEVNGGTILNGTSCSYSNSTQTTYTAQETTIQRLLAPVPRPANLLDPTGRYFTRSKPQYEARPVGDFLPAKLNGAVGDGVTGRLSTSITSNPLTRLADDTAAVQALFNRAAAQNKIAYFDHGAYLITSTVNVPANLKITGECLPIIMASGSFFGDQLNPKPMFRVGNPGDPGSVEVSDIVFETKGPAPGAIIVEWNIAASSPGAAGMWDTHWRIGGSAGTQLQMDTCLKNPSATATASSTVPCQGAFLLLHVTSKANIYLENTWGWVADHELDLSTRSQIDIYNGRYVADQASPISLLKADLVLKLAAFGATQC